MKRTAEIWKSLGSFCSLHTYFNRCKDARQLRHEAHHHQVVCDSCILWPSWYVWSVDRNRPDNVKYNYNYRNGLLPPLVGILNISLTRTWRWPRVRAMVGYCCCRKLEVLAGVVLCDLNDGRGGRRRHCCSSRMGPRGEREGNKKRRLEPKNEVTDSHCVLVAASHCEVGGLATTRGLRRY